LGGVSGKASPEEWGEKLHCWVQKKFTFLFQKNYFFGLKKRT
jgi:hypothetical protein